MANNLKHLKFIGLSYKKSNVDVRNRFAFTPEKKKQLNKKLSENAILDSLVLSTCNRSELYYIDKSEKSINRLLAEIFESNEREISELMYSMEGVPALRHFYKVTCGLDSQITGDYDIINQIKEASISPATRDELGNFMERMVNSALNTSKLVKKHTKISSGHTSVSYAAVHYLKEKIDLDPQDHALVLGTGTIGTAVAQNFKAVMPKQPLILMNRNLEKAENIAKNLSGVAVAPFDEMNNMLQVARVILVCTGAQGKDLLTASQLSPELDYHVLDLSLPSDVENEVKQLGNVNYYNLDEVSRLVQKTLDQRQGEIPKAEEIIDQKIKEFIKWDAAQRYAPYLKLTREQLIEASKNNVCPFPHAKENQDEINDLVKNMAKKARVGEIHACSYINAFLDLMEERGSKKELIKIGTRDSTLAIYQAHKVEEQLLSQRLNCTIKTIKSEGDMNLVSPLYDMGIEGVFTKALDIALLDDTIDLAVHSLKDVPTQLAQGLSLVSVLKRAAHQDVAILKKGLNWEDLPDRELIVASSSVRRRAQWKHQFPRHNFSNIRGNIQTRIKKFYEGDYDVLIMAKAAIERLDLKLDNIVELNFLPSPAQGIIGIVCRSSDKPLMEHIVQFNDEASFLCGNIERQFLREMGGGCASPIGALAEIKEGVIHFAAEIIHPKGLEKMALKKEVRQESFQMGLVKEWATELHTKGAQKLLI